MEEAGVLSGEEVKKVTPPRERARRGPVAVIECLERIPCDACVYCCPVGAITKHGITEPPRIDHEKCTGCGKCVLECPGLAIFLVELVGGGKARVTVPYEFLPVPANGQEVIALDRRGREIATGRVARVVVAKDKTAAVTIEVPGHLSMEVRAIRV